MYISFKKVPVQFTAAQKAQIHDFVLDHIRSLGMLPLDMELDNNGEAMTIDYDQILSALDDAQFKALCDEYEAIEQAQMDSSEGASALDDDD